MADNPWLKVDNPYEANSETQKQAEDYQREFDRLCWSVFHQNEDGKALYERLSQRYLQTTQLNPMSPTAQTEAVWWDGFKCAITGLYNLGAKHIRSINTEGLNVSG